MLILIVLLATLVAAAIADTAIALRTDGYGRSARPPAGFAGSPGDAGRML